MVFARAFAITVAAFAAFPASAQQAAQTTQQRFDAGGEAIRQRDWQKALDLYAKLESDLSAKRPDSKSLPIIRLRKGLAMEGLRRYDDAEPVLVGALEALPNGPELAEDRYLAWKALAVIADEHLDYPQFVARLHQASSAAAYDDLKLAVLVRSVPVNIFVDPAEALRDLDAAQALVDSIKPKTREWAGLIHNYRGRALMNMGDLTRARAELDQAIKLLGGLSYGKVNLLDTAARSDAAIAALLDKRPDRARELLTFAGASMAGEQGFGRARDMSRPSCDIPGLAPTDVAILEFAIREDGSVTAIRPIYFSGKRQLAVEFARAVARWSWDPEQLKKLDAFFRAQSRIELRCTNRFSQPSGADLLTPAVGHWLQQSNIPPSKVSADLPDATQLTALRAELKERQTQTGVPGREALPTLMALAKNSVIPWSEGSADAHQAYDLALANGAQGEVKAWFLLRRLAYDASRWRGRSDAHYQREIANSLTDPAFAEDARAQAALRITLFDSLNASARTKDGKSILEPLISSQRLENSDPLLVGARIRLANLEYAAGNLDAARAHFDKSGLTAQQCALVDAQPAQTRGVRTDNFPQEALRWHLAGWTVTEFDVSPDGKPLNVRTTAAFPPFVFGSNSEERIGASRYQQTYRPGNERGCVANQLGVHYEIN